MKLTALIGLFEIMFSVSRTFIIEPGKLSNGAHYNLCPKSRSVLVAFIVHVSYYKVEKPVVHAIS